MRLKDYMSALAFALGLLLGGMVSWSYAEQVAIEFTYTGEAESYSLYMDESVYCGITKADITEVNSNLQMTCDPADIDPGWHSFSMTATLAEGTETKHSNEFQWFKPFPDPVIPAKPTVITITIGINGEQVILQ